MERFGIVLIFTIDFRDVIRDDVLNFLVFLI